MVLSGTKLLQQIQMEWCLYLLQGQNQDILVRGVLDQAKLTKLGNSSGTRLLQTISDLLPESNTLDQVESPARASQIGSPSLLVHFANTAVVDHLVDAYFLSYNRSYPILHESTFREKYRNRQQIHSRSSWHLIFYLVLAIGHWISTGGTELSQCSYYMAARSRMSMRMLESGSLVAVQAFLMMVGISSLNESR